MKHQKPENSDQSSEEFAIFDVLRFFLASFVAIYHTGAIGWNSAGNLCVQVFFALSGWLIGGILFETSKKDLPRFYYNRATRVWIPYYSTVVVLYALSFLHEPTRSSRWFEFLVYDLSFTHNWFSLLPSPELALKEMPLAGTGNHFWSLSVEEQFYLAAPILIIFTSIGKKIWVWAVISIIAIATASWYGSICLGVFGVLCMREGQKWPTGYRQLGYAFFVLIIATGIMVNNPLSYEYAAPFFAISLVVLCAVPVKRNVFTKWIGGISYPLYLNAWIGIFIFNVISKYLIIKNTNMQMVIEYFLAVLVSTVSYAMIDRLVMKHRNQFFRDTLGKSICTLAYTLLAIGTLYGFIQMMR